MDKPTPYVLMIWFFYLILCCSPAAAFNDSLPYCDNSKKPTLVDTEKSFFHSRDEDAKCALYIRINTRSRKNYCSSSFKSTNYHVTTKNANKVHGVGWQGQFFKTLHHLLQNISLRRNHSKRMGRKCQTHSYRMFYDGTV